MCWVSLTPKQTEFSLGLFRIGNDDEVATIDSEGHVPKQLLVLPVDSLRR